MYDSRMKGIGIETRRCQACHNLQDVLAIEGAITLFFRCEKCSKETYLNDESEKLISPSLTISTI